jgi:cytochrome c oxidase subunit 2
VGAVAADGNPERGKQFFVTCQGCHGERAQGKKESGAPRLANQHGWYLTRQLQNFRDGIRGSHEDDSYGQLMSAMAKTLPDQQAVLDVVSYIMTLDVGAVEQTGGNEVTEKGRITFASCQSCHGLKAEGNQAIGAPRLAGQYQWYLIRQLQNFKGDMRGTHELDTYGQTMRSMAHALLPDEQTVRDVVAYIATLQ